MSYRSTPEKDAARFWAHVDKTEGCWIWTASLNETGYGRVRFGGKEYKAHRLAFVLSGNVIPPGLDLDHLCRNKACVNPAHLEPVTRSQNLLRSEITIPSLLRAGTHRLNRWTASVEPL